MNDFIVDPKLWELGADNPQVQEAIIKAMSAESGYYSIPTGDITVSAFSKENAQRDKMVQAIKIARDMKVSDIAGMLAELKHALILKDVTGTPLQDYEKTLRDIDITALAVFALVKWLGTVKHEGTQNAD